MNDNNNINANFNLPDDYFNNSKQSILNKIEWLEEHKNYPILSLLNKEHGFIYPEKYFNGSDILLESVLFSDLNSNLKTNPFSVPENYFNENRNALNAANSDSEEYPLLNKLSKNNVFIVKDEYFENNKKIISEKIIGKKDAKVISLFPKTWRFAAAAILIIGLGALVFIYNNKNVNTVVDEDCNTLACIEKRELLKYKLDNLENEELYDLVNSKKLEEKLNKLESDSTKRITSDSADNALIDYIE